eukprot:g3893.t1
MLTLSTEQLDQTLEACSYIFQKAAYNKLKPANLSRRLTETLEMGEKQSAIFGQVWSKESPGVISALSKHTLGGPKVLTGTDWRVSLQVGQQTKSHMMEPRAIFQLSLADGADDDASDHSTLEFSADELASFFTKLETVQKQLDKLGYV